MPFSRLLNRPLFAWPRARGHAAEPSSSRIRTIVHEHWDAMYQTARRLGVPSRDIEDVLQEVLVVVIRREADIVVLKERAFVVGATVRVVANWRRRARRHPEDATETVDEIAAHDVGGPPTARGGEDGVERSRRLALLQSALAAMTEPQRVAFILFELEEWTAREIAAELGASEATVVSRVRRAREVFWRFRERHRESASALARGERAAPVVAAELAPCADAVDSVGREP